MATIAWGGQRSGYGGTKDKGLMDMDNSVIAQGKGSIWGLNGNGKNTIKIEKQLGIYKSKPIGLSPEFSTKTLQARGSDMIYST